MKKYKSLIIILIILLSCAGLFGFLYRKVNVVYSNRDNETKNNSIIINEGDEKVEKNSSIDEEDGKLVTLYDASLYKRVSNEEFYTVDFLVQNGFLEKYELKNESEILDNGILLYIDNNSGNIGYVESKKEWVDLSVTDFLKEQLSKIKIKGLYDFPAYHIMVTCVLDENDNLYQIIYNNGIYELKKLNIFHRVKNVYSYGVKYDIYGWICIHTENDDIYIARVTDKEIKIIDKIENFNDFKLNIPYLDYGFYQNLYLSLDDKLYFINGDLYPKESINSKNAVLDENNNELIINAGFVMREEHGGMIFVIDENNKLYKMIYNFDSNGYEISDETVITQAKLYTEKKVNKIKIKYGNYNEYTNQYTILKIIIIYQDNTIETINNKEIIITNRVDKVNNISYVFSSDKGSNWYKKILRDN